jgi:hypothetical protein
MREVSALTCERDELLRKVTAYEAAAAALQRSASGMHVALRQLLSQPCPMLQLQLVKNSCRSSVTACLCLPVPLAFSRRLLCYCPACFGRLHNLGFSSSPITLSQGPGCCCI